jgi:hypothetical protein
MQGSAEKMPQPVFRPVKLELILESQDEVDAWWALFNHLKISEFLGFEVDEPNLLADLTVNPNQYAGRLAILLDQKRD